MIDILPPFLFFTLVLSFFGAFVIGILNLKATGRESAWGKWRVPLVRCRRALVESRSGAVV